MKTKLAVVTLWAEDVTVMSDFYRNVIGLPLLMIDRDRPHFDFGGGYLVILPGKPCPKLEPGLARFPVLAFSVDDLHAFVQHLESRQVELPWGVEEDHDSRWVMFYDPGGNLIEVAMFRVNPHHARS